MTQEMKTKLNEAAQEIADYSGKLGFEETYVNIERLAPAEFRFHLEAITFEGRKLNITRPMRIEEDDLEHIALRMINSGYIYANMLLGSISTKH